jgi:hypothetical protein
VDTGREILGTVFPTIMELLSTAWA